MLENLILLCLVLLFSWAYTAKFGSQFNLQLQNALSILKMQNYDIQVIVVIRTNMVIRRQNF